MARHDYKMGKSKPHQQIRHEGSERAKAIGGRIKQARENLGLSQHDLAIQLGTTAGAVGQWERGANSPSAMNMEKLPELLKVSADYLLFGTSDAERARAQTAPEQRVLELLRERPEAAVVAMNLLERWGEHNGCDPVETTAIVEAWTQLDRNKRRLAATMVNRLAKTKTDPEHHTKDDAFDDVMHVVSALRRLSPELRAAATGMLVDIAGHAEASGADEIGTNVADASKSIKPVAKRTRRMRGREKADPV